MNMDGKQLKAAIGRVCKGLHGAAAELNELDGALGDGDLGATLDKCATNVESALPQMNDDISSIFAQTSAACAKASGSSFGTLLAVALLISAKQAKYEIALTRTTVAGLMHEIVSVLSARGGASLGDKTVLDSLDAVGQMLNAANDDDNLRDAAQRAAGHALELYRHKPNRIGRARMFTEKSVGLDDPGMVALLRMIESA